MPALFVTFVAYICPDCDFQSSRAMFEQREQSAHVIRRYCTHHSAVNLAAQKSLIIDRSPILCCLGWNGSLGCIGGWFVKFMHFILQIPGKLPMLCIFPPRVWNVWICVCISKPLRYLLGLSGSDGYTIPTLIKITCKETSGKWRRAPRIRNPFVPFYLFFSKINWIRYVHVQLVWLRRLKIKLWKWTIDQTSMTLSRSFWNNVTYHFSSSSLGFVH